MKKTLISVAVVAFLVVIAVFIVWGFAYFMTAKSGLDGLFPEDTVLYCQLTDRTVAEANFKASKFFSAFEHSKFAGELDILSLITGGENKDKVAEVKEFLNFFQHGAAVGVFGIDIKKEKFNVVFAGDVGKNRSAFKEYIESRFKDFVEKNNRTVEEEKFDSETVYSFELEDGKKVAYSVAGDYFFIGYPVKAVETSILCSKGSSGKVLADSEVFKRAKDETEFEKGFLLFANLEGIVKSFEKAAGSKESSFLSAFDGYVEMLGLSCVKSVCWNSYISDGYFHDSGFVAVDFDSKGILPVLLNSKPRKIGSSGRFIPAHFPIISISSVGDLTEGWNKIIQAVEDSLSEEQWGNVSGGINFIEKGLNFNITEDFLGTIEDEIAVGYYLPDVMTRPSSDFSSVLEQMRQYEVIIASKVKDEKALSSTLERLGYMGVAELKEKIYRNFKLKSFVLSSSTVPFSPSYAFVDDFVVIAQSAETLESAIDAYLDEKSAVDDSDWAEAEKLCSGKVNQCSMVKSELYGNMIAATLMTSPAYDEWKNSLGFDPAKEVISIFNSLSATVSSAVRKDKGYYCKVKSSYPVFLGTTVFDISDAGKVN